MSHKDFEFPDLSKKKPPSFGVGGEKFACLPDIPAVVWRDLFAGRDSLDKGQVALFIEWTLVAEDKPRWRNLTSSADPKRMVTSELLVDIYHHLQEAYSGRPSQGRRRSASGPPPTGASSEDA